MTEANATIALALGGYATGMSLFSHPIKKFIYLSAFAGGYVLGAKAGRERYEQILQAVGQVKDDPRVKQAAHKAEDMVKEAATTVAEKPQVKEAASKAKDAVKKATSTAKPEAGAKSDTKVEGVNPLLADEHVATDAEVVYSTGPDIEETVDQLAPSNDAERT